MSASYSLLYEASKVSFLYRLGNTEIQALESVSCEIKQGERISLSGPSGSGKSTLLNLLGLIEDVQAGSLRFMGREVSKLKEREKNRLRKFELGFIFQSFHLFPVLSAEENVEYFLIKQGLNSKQRKQRVKEALESVQLWEHRQKKPLEMSGGQRQRIAIARAIAKKPQVILADEPTASLDQGTGKEIMSFLKSLNEKEGTTLIVCSHDPMVQGYCNRHIQLKDGRLG